MPKCVKLLNFTKSHYHIVIKNIFGSAHDAQKSIVKIIKIIKIFFFEINSHFHKFTFSLYCCLVKQKIVIEPSPPLFRGAPRCGEG